MERERKQESSDKECEPLNRERSSFSIFKSERSRFFKREKRERERTWNRRMKNNLSSSFSHSLSLPLSHYLPSSFLPISSKLINSWAVGKVLNWTFSPSFYPKKHHFLYHFFPLSPSFFSLLLPPPFILLQLSSSFPFKWRILIKTKELSFGRKDGRKKERGGRKERDREKWRKESS